MANSARIDELKKKFDENPRRYFAPLANEFRKSGEIDQAIMICEEFLPQQPGHMSGHIVYGQALFEASRFHESRTVFETALGLDPENLIALRHLGDIAMGEGDAAGARNWYVRVLDADPRNDEIQALIASIGNGTDVGDGNASGELPPDPAEEEFVPSFMKETPTPVTSTYAPPVETPAIEVAAIEAPMDALPMAIDPSLIDTLPAGMPAVTADRAGYERESDEGDLLSGFSVHDFDTPVLGSESAAAEGLESTSFIAPVDERIESLDLDDSLSSGIPEFQTPAASVSALPGLQASGGMARVDLILGAPPSVVLETVDIDALEIDDGTSTTPHGDPVSSSAPTPIAAAPVVADFSFDDSPSDTGLTIDAMESSVLESGAAYSDDIDYAESASTTYRQPESVAANEIPMELPPSVIAAEAELLDESVADDTLAPGVAPFVTETMAELYVAQGFREEALNVYEQLLAANPGDSRLSEIIRRLSPAEMSPTGAPEGTHDDFPRARDFFAMIASRRPGSLRAAAEPPSDYDFSSDAAAGLEDSVAADADVPTGGSIDALFGNSAPQGSEDSAAAALAQAFGSATPAEPMIVGKAARAADDELSLDSVFRDAPQRANRTSQSFSFDQFFAGGTPSASPRIPQPNAEDAPAERSADDIEQFNSWLQGLKPK